MKGDWFGLKCRYSRYLLLSTFEWESLVSQETRTDALYNDNVFTGQTHLSKHGIQTCRLVLCRELLCR